MKRLKPVIDYAVYVAVRLLIATIQAFSIETCHSVCRVLAWLLYDVAKLRRKIIDENLFTALPDVTPQERRRIALATWEHLLLMICEVAHAPRKIHETNWRDYVSLHRRRELVSYLLDKRPVVIVSGHFGNFEVAGFMTGLFGVPTHTVARTLDNPYLDRFLNRFREAKGQYILPKQGSAGDVEKLLASGGKILLLGDQSSGPKGCFVEFFGRPSSCHKAIALFTLTSQVPLIVAYGRRKTKPMQFEIGLLNALDPQSEGLQLEGISGVTQWYTSELEAIVRAYPDQYWWLHRRWKESPPKKWKKPESAKPGVVQRRAA